MNATSERRIKCPDAVGRQEEDPRIIFQHPQEDTHDRVSFEVLLGSSHKEDTGSLSAGERSGLNM